MKILSGALNSMTAADIDQLCADAAAEGTELELKQDLPARDGRQDPSHSGGSFGEHANAIISSAI
jgi:hypothetical protein